MAEISFIIPTFHIPSVNELYQRRLNAEGGEEVYISPEMERNLGQMKTFLADNYPLGFVNAFSPQGALYVEYDFILKENVWKRDVTNMIKAVQDIVTRYIGIDDSNITRLYARKSLRDDISLEYVSVRITDETTEARERRGRSIVIPTSYIPSYNSTYHLSSQSRRVFKSDEVRKYQTRLEKFIKESTDLCSYSFIGNRTPLATYYDFYLNSMFESKEKGMGGGVTHSRDVDNMIKATEDGIFNALPTDDRYVVEVYASKHRNENGKKGGKGEYITFCIEPSNYDIHSFDKKKK